MQLGTEEDVEEALESYRMCLILNPKMVDAHSNLGNLHKTRGRLEEAKRCYLEAIRLYLSSILTIFFIMDGGI